MTVAWEFADAWVLADEGASVFAEGAGDLRAHLGLIEASLLAFEPGRAVVELPRGAMDSALEGYRGGSGG